MPWLTRTSGIATATWRERLASRDISAGPRQCHDGCRSVLLSAIAARLGLGAVARALLTLGPVCLGDPKRDHGRTLRANQALSPREDPVPALQFQLQLGATPGLSAESTDRQSLNLRPGDAAEVAVDTQRRSVRSPGCTPHRQATRRCSDRDRKAPAGMFADAICSTADRLRTDNG
jgi:hypothetical protein